MFRAAFKTALVLFLASSYKTLPLAWCIRFYLYIFKHLVLKKAQYIRTKKNTYGFGERKLDVFRGVEYHTYASPLEIDLYLHKSNSTYLADLDIARTHFVCQVFQTLFLKYWQNETGEFRGKSLQNCPYVPIGTIQCAFKREIKMFQRYLIVSSVFAWDHKWLYVLLKFQFSDGKLAAVAITKYVFKKKGRITMKPRDFLAESGLYNSDVELINAENYKLVSSLETSEGLEKWAATMEI
ncbi:hypothetical protein METBIDRAFT_113184 [Metschnikowia bicuspidata var. bicuspidata NRRL YB-4993]|uniref:Thioesterase/thiol ester dehydrase-isomerase n=1 Tax=Metschnikowia bicuspidata var. bicuspidata NRRL YB-4993 TaxID=869754 RepID=A0A1A0HIT0_9ASCO|nr:hypothetical protein METBIDRAFT_113184 [Metschnikowia bicuspidata var. bicuspidata NRRL YB-4993]OBA23792.1 hypothetical protein METBIDRAFT_113184 [Metschnikowia bicuspidata var. bicuspidata NRRL YB-4993]